MAFKNFEEYEEYLRAQMLPQEKTEEIIKKGILGRCLERKKEGTLGEGLAPSTSPLM